MPVLSFNSGLWCPRTWLTILLASLPSCCSLKIVVANSDIAVGGAKNDLGIGIASYKNLILTKVISWFWNM